MILLDNKYVSVEYHTTESCIAYTWKGFVPNSVLRPIMEDIQGWIKEYQATVLLSNLKNITAVSKEDQMWLAQEFTPAIIKLGIKISAIVLPISAFGKLSNQEVERQSTEDISTILVQNFDDEQKAFDWIRTLQNNS